MKNPAGALFLLLPFLFFPVQELAIAAMITFTNNCSYTVWPGTLATGDQMPQLSTTGFELPIGASKSVNIPFPWSGQIWGRTGCSNDSGIFVCVTGDCGSGQVECNGAGASPPTTLVELTTASKSGQELYHVSNVNGFNLPMSIVPKGGSGNCNSSSCPANITSDCPEVLQVRWSDGSVIACKSACLAFNEPMYCCTGDFNTTDKCQSTMYSDFFEERCPDAYSYAHDNFRLNGSFTCSGRPSYNITFCPYHTETAAQSIGVCYGRDGNNLPSNQDVVALYKSNRIARMRIYNPDEQALQALRGSNIEVILGVPNDRLQSVTNASTATDWVNQYVKPYASDVKFRYIAVGNEVQPGDASLAESVLPAIRNIQSSISAAKLQGQIKVSTAIDSRLITNSYPPNAGVFTDTGYIKPIVDFLASNGAPILASIYPYFSYTDNKQSITAEYALFTQRGKNDAGYKNLFDALLDSMYAALEKVGHPDMQIVVSESGWPSEGGDSATVENASTYYRNLISHVKGGTPKKPNGPIETYLFAMFDENLKVGAKTEKHLGLFRPDKSPKYQLIFN